MDVRTGLQAESGTARDEQHTDQLDDQTVPCPVGGSIQGVALDCQPGTTGHAVAPAAPIMNGDKIEVVVRLL